MQHVEAIDNSFKEAGVDKPLSLRIDQLLSSKGCSKAWLANQLGVSRQALNYILKHKRQPSFLSEIAELLNVNPNWLKTGEGSMLTQGATQPKDTILIAVYSMTELESAQSTLELKSNTQITSHNLEDQNTFAVQIENYPAMSGKFPNNSILIFEPSGDAQNDDFILAKVCSVELTAIVIRKMILLNEKDVQLTALNCNYPSINITSEKSLEILGVLKEVRIRL